MLVYVYMAQLHLKPSLYLSLTLHYRLFSLIFNKNGPLWRLLQLFCLQKKSQLGQHDLCISWIEIAEVKPTAYTTLEIYCNFAVGYK